MTLTTMASPLNDFTAITDCPKCGHIAVHWLSTPVRATVEQWEAYERRLEDYDPFSGDETRVVAWGGDTVKTVQRNPPPPSPRDEPWPLARECRSCAHRWGNK